MEEHERVVLIDNHGQEPVLVSYRDKEKTEPIIYLYKELSRQSQLVRDQIGLDLGD